MKLGTSYLSHKIYAGNTRIDKKTGMELWTKKEDVTEEAIKAVFEFMYIKAEEKGGYEISIEGFGKKTFVRDKKDNK